ncbi:MAG: thiol:disulfide interchange protein DsbA/DsbL [Nevskiales bacterium]|nr:thiol:disulfide interchange protein DsbA/DsbL [Nevskiales bacterium]
MRSSPARVALAPCLLLAALLPMACTAKDEPPMPRFILGQHYKPVRTISPTANPDKIEVAEAFWYGCIHCFQFEPEVDRWLAKKPRDVEFVRLPSSLGRPTGLLHSRAFYTAEQLGILDRIHKPLFRAIHEQGSPLDTADSLRAFFAKNAGVKAADFDDAFNGFAVDSRVRRTEAALREMGIAGVPAIVVDGRYYSQASMAGNHEALLAVTDFLIKRVREERKSR